MGRKNARREIKKHRMEREREGEERIRDLK